MNAAPKPRKLGRPPKPAKRSQVVSCAVTEEVAARLRASAASLDRRLSTHLQALLALLTEIDEGDLRRLITYWRAVSAATEDAGDKPELWFRYAQHVSFPPNPDDPEFPVMARERVRVAVDREIAELRRIIEQRGEPTNPELAVVAKPTREEAHADAEHRYAARRYKEIVNRRGKRSRKEDR